MAKPEQHAQPEQHAPPVQRLRIRYAKRGRARFASQRDFARAFERALRRVGVPMAYSSGFSPHPRISYAGAALTGAASEAEYLEIALAGRCDPERVREALDESLPSGLDVLAVVEATGPGLAERLTGSIWLAELPGMPVEPADRAVAALIAADSVSVERITRQGPRSFDVRGAVVDLTRLQVVGSATLRTVLRHVTPLVRPDDVLTALAQVEPDFRPPQPAKYTRLSQGELGADGAVADPLNY